MLDGNTVAYIGLGLGAGLMTTAAVAGAALPFSKTLQQKVFPKPKESLLSDLLPFHHFMDGGDTIVCKDGTWSRVIALEGMITDTLTVEERIAKGTNRWKWLDKFAEEGMSFTIMTHRQLVKGQDSEVSYSNPILQQIDEQWKKNFEKAYANRHYLLLSKKPDKDLIKELVHWDDMKKVALDYLGDYGPKVLKETETESGLLSFWSHLINSFDDHPVFGRGSVFLPLSRRLVSSVVNFLPQQGMIEWQDGPKKRYGAVISIHEWGESLDDDMMQDILSLPCEMRWVHYVKGFKNEAAIASLKNAAIQGRLAFNTKQSQAQNEEAQEWIQNKSNSLYEVQSCLFLETDDKEHLEKVIEKVRSSFRLKGLKPVHETQAMETLWISQFPGYEQFLISHRLFSQNVAALCPFPKEHLGLNKTDWGEGALRVFRTSSGSRYAFQLHVSDQQGEVAHSLVLAPTGGGKTTLFQFLISGALRHKNLQAYIFDRFCGTQVFTKSVGGKVIDLGQMGDLQINPFQCEETEENTAFLIDFLGDLAGIKMEEKALEGARRAVQEIFDLPMKDRSLTNIYKDVFQKDNPLTLGLKPWVQGGAFARYFNGKVDDLDIRASQLVTFEMASLESVGMVYPAMLNYLMHRIRAQLRRTKEGSPHLVFVDESAPMLANPLFQEHAKKLLWEHRKLRGSVTLCFQSMGSVMNSPLREVILGQCPTVFIFPNPGAQREDYAALNLTDSQWDFVKGTKRLNLTRGVLVKRNRSNADSEAVYLDVDISGLGRYIKLYSSDVKSVNLVKELQEKYQQQDWVPVYLGDVK